MAKETYELGSVTMKTHLGGPRDKAAEKPHDFRNAWKMLLKYGRKELPILIGSLIAAVAGALFSLFGPAKLSTITDMVSDGISTGVFDLSAITHIGLNLLMLYGFSFGLMYLQNFLMVSLSQRMRFSMRDDCSRKLNRLPLSRFDSENFGDLMSRVTNDIDTITDAMRMALAEVVSAATLFIGSVILMYRTNSLLASIAIVSSLGGFLLMTLIIRKSQKYFSGNSYYLGLINGHIEEIFAAHPIVKSFNGELEERKHFMEYNDHLYENGWKSQFLSGIMMPVMEFVGNFGYVAVCVAGAVMAREGIITFGTIVAFIVYVKLFTQPLGQVAQSATSLQSAAAASERVFAFLDEPEMEDESEKKNDFVPHKGHVSFDHVKFSYVKGHPIIHDFSVDVKPGEKVAIVGPTGAGKTTIVNLLMRFYELDGGTITIDGMDISKMTRENVHRMFGMVLQDTWIFEDTIKNNIIYSKPGVTDQEVEDACIAVGLDSFIQSLPDGYNTILKDDSNLSAGQRQLLTIARAMVADQPLLILDEATSSVDTRTEQAVQNAMDTLTTGRTSFTIAHRLSTIRSADMILVMNNGGIVEKGTHEELLAKKGFYSKLWQSQFVKAEQL
ncbi:MAG: ABC transporter ATP-binding protein/permease [Solobacterium sp.]|jgi:ATP-binding cassette subfamily B protein|nr:ABC transporter ATP-binding protein/permease [Solobacterium sp.]